MAKSIPLNPNKEAIVEALFRDHFESLSLLSMKYIGDINGSKDIVHEVFISFWQKFDGLPADTKYKSYLFTAVRNKSFNYLRDKKIHLDIHDTEMQISSGNEASLETEELAREIAYVLNLLPDRCREVFELSRHEGLKYSQIAENLDISIKTVEAQMSKALRLMRDHLKEFLVLLITLFGFG